MADNGGYIGRNPGDASVTIARQTYEPSGVTTEFTFDSGYTPGYMDVYLNGVRLVEGLDYSSSNGTSVGLSSAAEGGDVLECVAYKRRRSRRGASVVVARAARGLLGLLQPSLLPRQQQ